MTVNLQGICKFNPKTKEYLVNIGNLLFPFESIDEIFEYLKRRIKHE